MLSISNTTKKKILSSKKDFISIKDSILGKKYELSLVFVGQTKAKTLNKKYRNKKYSPNILSFPIDKMSGEIFINLDQTKKEHKDFDMSHKDYIKYLFIHGSLHLKGLDHGKKMSSEEDKFIKKFIS